MDGTADTRAAFSHGGSRGMIRATNSRTPTMRPRLRRVRFRQSNGRRPQGRQRSLAPHACDHGLERIVQFTSVRGRAPQGSTSFQFTSRVTGGVEVAVARSWNDGGHFRKQSSVEIAQEAAISRLCPIQDAYGFWNMDRSSPVTGSGGPAPVSSGTVFSTRRDGLYITSLIGPIMTWSRAWK
jgi:hypothetical protein